MSFARPAAGQSVVDIFHEFEKLAAKQLWPGFEPAKIPVAIYDGKQTYLFHHPSPPREFHKAAEGYFVLDGRHPAVTSNYAAEIGGVVTATVVLEGTERNSLAALGALPVHETFHVFELKHLASWQANEAELFTYPVTDAEVLRDRRRETEALRRALTANNDSGGCWVELGLQFRRSRFGRMPANSVTYERHAEMWEGLAQYVEHKSYGRQPTLPADEYPADRFRQRAYDVGESFAVLLDRSGEQWKSEVGRANGASLDELLAQHFSPSPAKAPEKCSFTSSELAAAETRAGNDIEQLVAQRAALKRDFLSQPGLTLTIMAGAEPLWSQGFDPLNVTLLDKGEVLHSRFAKFGKKTATLEVINHKSLTETAGAHPLFNGVRKVAVTGLSLDTQVATSPDGTVQIKADGLEFRAVKSKIQRSKDTLTIQLP